MSKNILITTGIFPPDMGGPANYVSILIRELPQKNYNLQVITYSDNQDSQTVSEKINGVLIKRISRKQNIFFRYAKYFFNVFILSKKADIIYTQGAVSDGLPTYLATKLRRKKYYLKIVGDHAWEQGRQRFGVGELLPDFQTSINKNPQKFPWSIRLMRKIECKVAQSAQLIITPSNFLKNIIKEWGVAQEKITVIYNSVKNIDLPKAENKNDFVLVSVGRLVAWKGFDLLVEVVKDLQISIPDLKLNIIGDGTDKEKLTQKIKQLNLEKVVFLKPGMKQDELFQEISRADLFVLNTGYEGLSHLLIETMRLEVPIITTNIGGNPEVIQDEINGLLIEYNNFNQLRKTILKLYQDESLRKKLAQQAKKDSLEKFSQEKMINDLVNILV